MKANLKREINIQINKVYVKDILDKMLECLLGREGMQCNICKTCSFVDSCCFLVDAVFVVHYKESRKANSE
jgi:hypothetical protein